MISLSPQAGLHAGAAPGKGAFQAGLDYQGPVGFTGLRLWCFIFPSKKTLRNSFGVTNWVDKWRQDVCAPEKVDIVCILWTEREQGFLQRISGHALKFHDVYLIDCKLGRLFYLEDFRLSTLDRACSKYLLNWFSTGKKKGSFYTWWMNDEIFDYCEFHISHMLVVTTSVFLRSLNEKLFLCLP